MIIIGTCEGKTDVLVEGTRGIVLSELVTMALAIAETFADNTPLSPAASQLFINQEVMKLIDKVKKEGDTD